MIYQVTLTDFMGTFHGDSTGTATSADTDDDII